MSIKFVPESASFHLTAKDTSYVISIVDDEKFVAHTYFGKKIPDENVNYLLRLGNYSLPSKNNRERVNFYSTFPQEFSTSGLGDFREPCLMVRDKNGNSCCSLNYRAHKIYAGKPKLEGLPCTFGSESECTTLELECEDSVLGLEITLLYTVFENLDVIARSVKVKNCSGDPIDLLRVLSACVDFDGAGYEMVTQHGAWARERHVQKRPVLYGKSTVDSSLGKSGHEQNPFMALMAPGAGDENGEVFGFNFVYSGNFFMQAELSPIDLTRVVMGINPYAFSWRLEPGESFTAPEVIIVYSDKGLDKMTSTFHDLYRNHLIRGEYKDKKRPILINNWEATYFNFNTEKLIDIAKEASKSGIEMLVMDDGWFGKRNDDNSSLGDWFVNEEKLKGGLKYLVDEVNKLGMKFGIWVEPEMISPDSELYRKHPDWCLKTPGREPSLARNQLVLDYSRQDVRDYIYETMCSLLSSANIEYVKWDMNRPLTNMGSACLPKERQGELYHRHVLGLYEILEKLTEKFPHVLLEHCSGGGARFDPGMLYYSPQIWCSDDTDAIERLEIQKGTALVYPVSTMGAHVSDVPNHVVGRSASFDTRGIVALSGTFGYELDVTRIPKEDREKIPGQVEMYHKYNNLVRTGDYYRLTPLFKKLPYECWGFVAKDKSEALVTYVCIMGVPDIHSRRIRLKGLDENAFYRNEETGEVFSGAVLMNAGININVNHDFEAKLFHFVRV